VYADEVPDGFDVVAVEPVEAGWEDRWRDFHRGALVGAFWIGPPWETPPAGVSAIVIDPGRAFGTGAHPTTRLCVQLLGQVAPGALLDVGCGSGVLSIAALKLGFPHAVGVDNDPAAIEAAQRNATVNGVRVEAVALDVLVDPLPAADVVVANVSLEVVTALLPRLDARVVITSGYLERDRVDGSVERRTLDGWAADVLERAE
jgi:ribosomal protein L11 methyltransferase